MNVLQGVAGIGLQALLNRWRQSREPWLLPTSLLKRMAALALAGLFVLLAALFTLVLLMMLFWPTLTVFQLIGLIIGVCLGCALIAYAVADAYGQQTLLPHPENRWQRMLAAFQRGWQR